MNVINQIINLQNDKISLVIKREDLIHPIVSGNKFRKLKYNLMDAQEKNHKSILTFGGAFSNHIAAVAFAGNQNDFKTIGVIRGDELEHISDENPTLKFAKECGMQLEFISRNQYKTKDDVAFLEQLKYKFGSFYHIPEGGTNLLAIKGCEEILTSNDNQFDYICCCVGTGGTISGIINSSTLHQKIIGFPALKGGFLENEIRKFATKDNWELISDYHFGGYGKINKELISFINDFYKEHKVLLDPIYTGKMVFGILDLINKGFFKKNARILVIHTGGIQGIQGINNILRNKNLPQINTNV